MSSAAQTVQAKAAIFSSCNIKRRPRPGKCQLWLPVDDAGGRLNLSRCNPAKSPAQENPNVFMLSSISLVPSSPDLDAMHSIRLLDTAGVAGAAGASLL